MHGSPLWWLFAALSAALWLVVMCSAMPTKAYRIGVAFGPLAVFLPILVYCAKYQEPLTEMLPVYCALVLSGPAGILGHRKALREALKDPNTSYGETQGPWTLQFAGALVVFLGLALYYVNQ